MNSTIKNGVKIQDFTMADAAAYINKDTESSVYMFQVVLKAERQV